MKNGQVETALPSIDDALRETTQVERVEALRGPDSVEGREVAAAVGVRVRRYRLRRDWSLDRLAERAGIDVEWLAQLEAGETVPSLRAIWTLATALEAPFGALLEQSMSAAKAFRVQRAHEGFLMSSSTGGMRSRALCPAVGDGAPEVYELTLAPGCREDAAPHGSRTYEHLTVVRGVLVLQSGGHVARLAPGDSVLFRADEPHGYYNPESVETIAHLVMTYTVEP